MKKERPILFSTPMVQADLGIKKTVTRRTKGLEFINEQPDIWFLDNDFKSTDYHQLYNFIHGGRVSQLCKCPYGKVGDILWVRETWFSTRFDCIELLDRGDTSHIRYKADGNYDPKKDCVGRSWKPSIHMPKAASRIWLEITGTRLERLHAVTDFDAMAEGITEFTKDGNIYKYGLDGWDWSNMPRTARDGFLRLWEIINGKESLDSNPYVWVIEFKRIERP